MGRWTSLKEALIGVPQEVPAVIDEVKGTIVLGTVKQSTGERPSTSFSTQVRVFNSDPVIKEATVGTAQQVISNGFFTSQDSLFTVTLPHDDGYWSPKEAVDYWNMTNDVDNKLLQAVTELIAFGNSFWLVTDNGLKNIPIESVNRTVPRGKNIPVQDEYDLELTAEYGSRIIRWGTFVHFKINPTGMGGLGSGIILGILAHPDHNSEEPSLWDMRKSVRRSMKTGFEKFSFGNEKWTFEGLSDEATEALGKEITEMGGSGNRIVTNKKGDIQMAIPTRTQSYDAWIQQTWLEFLMTQGNPSLRMSVEGYYSKSTAITAKELWEYCVASYRRVIKRGMETIWASMLENLGFDAVKAQVKMTFTGEIQDIAAQDIFSAVDKKIITIEEARELLKNVRRWRLEK